MSSANVNSLDALRHLRSVLIAFSEECNETMVGLEMELRRGMQWLLDTQPKFWKNEERRLHDRVQEARQELSRCKSMALPGEVASCSEQKHALERAIQQLRHAEEKSKITKHWGRVIDHESHEWQGRANQFMSLLEGDMPKAIALLDRAISALEGYLHASSLAGSSIPRQQTGAAGGGELKPSIADDSSEIVDDVRTNAPPSLGGSDASR